jgi:hypothetical protein
MDSERAINLLASLNNRVSRTMDRFHIMIGAGISWAIVASGVILVIGWESDNPQEVFHLGIILIVASYISVLHFGRRYHRWETISNTILQAKKHIVEGATDFQHIVENVLGAVSNTAMPTWGSSFRHMTWGPYGIVYGAMIGVLVLSAQMKEGELPAKKVEVVNKNLNVSVENETLDVNMVNQPIDTNVVNWPDILDVNMVGPPLDVGVVSQPGPARYEYFVFTISAGAEGEGIFEENLNHYGAEVPPWEFVAFTYSDEGPKYIGIMRRPAEK